MYAANKLLKRETKGKAEKSAQKLSEEIYQTFFVTSEISLILTSAHAYKVNKKIVRHNQVSHEQYFVKNFENCLLQFG